MLTPLQGYAALAFMLVYTAVICHERVPVCWVLLAEIFRIQFAQLYQLPLSAQWIANWIVSLTFPMMNDNVWLTEKFNHGFSYWFTPLWVFYQPFCLEICSETKGKTLEEMEKLWKNKTIEIILKAAASKSGFDFRWKWITSLLSILSGVNGIRKALPPASLENGIGNGCPMQIMAGSPPPCGGVSWHGKWCFDRFRNHRKQGNLVTLKLDDFHFAPVKRDIFVRVYPSPMFTQPSAWIMTPGLITLPHIPPTQRV